MPSAKFTILFSHGNATDIGYMRDHLMDLAQTLQVNVFAYDYCGYVFFASSFVSLSEIAQSAKLECDHMLMHIIFVPL